jgi:hypothetical protein
MKKQVIKVHSLERLMDRVRSETRSLTPPDARTELGLPSRARLATSLGGEGVMSSGVGFEHP